MARVVRGRRCVGHCRGDGGGEVEGDSECDYNEIVKDGVCKACSGTTFPNGSENICVDC